MLLKPATPLTILFLIAFVLVLLSTISTPIVKSIPLAKHDGYRFGVFGYCKDDGSQCSSPSIGYGTGKISAQVPDQANVCRRSVERGPNAGQSATQQSA